SNSRIRSIWVKTQTRRSRSSPAACPVSVTDVPSLSPDARAELRAGRLVGPPAVVDRLGDLVGHVLVPAVAQLDPREVLERDTTQLVGGDAELAHVPRVDRDPAVRGAGSGGDRHDIVERP